MSLRKLASLASLLSLAAVTAQESNSIPPLSLSDPETTIRTWVDATGEFAIEASLIDWTEQEVRLLRTNGKRVAIDYVKLSELDQKYLASTVYVAQTPSDLAVNKATRPSEQASIKPTTVQITKEPLQLPAATSIAPDGENLKLAEPMRNDVSWPRLGKLAIDPPTSAASIPACVVSLDDSDGWATCSRPLLIETTPTPQIAISITRGVAFPSGGSDNQISLIDPATNELKTVWQGKKRITLLDHHAPSGLSLVLNDHNSVGEGGLLELLKLDSESLSLSSDDSSNSLRGFVRRALPENGKQRSPSKMTWARMLDREHVVAVIDATMGCWNLVSGECLYRVDKIDPRIEPVLSPGRRYLALPGSGEMLIYSSENGSPLGRVELDRNLTPSLAFSPNGDYLAIISGKRLRVLDMAQGNLIDEVSNARTLGTSSPVWINDDLIMSSNGIVLSRSRKTAVWQYDIVGDTITRVADRVALLKKYRGAQLAILELPHPAADATIARLSTTSVTSTSATSYSPTSASPAKSKWKDGVWVE